MEPAAAAHLLQILASKLPTHHLSHARAGHHVPPPADLPNVAHPVNYVELAEHAWELITDMRNRKLPMPFNEYLKLFALAAPTIVRRLPCLFYCAATSPAAGTCWAGLA
jgi:hypothetical protein